LRDPAGGIPGSEEPDEDEVDWRNMAEIQGRIEARKAVKDLEVARTTMSQLKAASDAASAAKVKPNRGETERDKTEGEKKTGTRKGAKKGSSTPSALESVGVSPVGPVSVVTGPEVERPAAESTADATNQKRPRSGKRANVDRHMDEALSTLKFTGIVEAPPTHVESAKGALDVELGIAFVAGALG